MKVNYKESLQNGGRLVNAIMNKVKADKSTLKDEGMFVIVSSTWETQGRREKSEQINPHSRMR
jgi:hypothetical protein